MSEDTNNVEIKCYSICPPMSQNNFYLLSRQYRCGMASPLPMMMLEKRSIKV